MAFLRLHHLMFDELSQVASLCSPTMLAGGLTGNPGLSRLPKYPFPSPQAVRMSLYTCTDKLQPNLGRRAFANRARCVGGTFAAAAGRKSESRTMLVSFSMSA